MKMIWIFAVIVLESFNVLWSQTDSAVVRTESSIASKKIFLETSSSNSYHYGGPGYNGMYKTNKKTFRIGENGEKKSLGMMGDTLRKYLEPCPEAVAKIDNYRNKKMFGYGLCGAGVAFLIYGVTAQEGTGEYTTTYENGYPEQVEKQEQTEGSILGYTLGAVSFVAGFVVLKSSEKLIEEAVEIFNANLFNDTDANKLGYLKIEPDKGKNLGLRLAYYF